MSSTRHRVLLGSSLLIFLTLAVSAPVAADVIHREMVLTVGQQQSIDARKVKSYSVGASDTIEVRVSTDGKALVLVGRKPGTTALLLILASGDKIHYTVRIAAAR